MHSYIHANTNGRLHPANEPSLSPLNRGFLYGDSIYEVWRTYDGVLFAWEEHWDRLERSADSLHMKLPFSQENARAEIKRTSEAYFRAIGGARHDIYVRLQVSRGCGPIGLDIQLADEPTFIFLIQENPKWAQGKLAAGLCLSMARELKRNSPECLNPAWKTGNYLNNILCLREARARGADEVVITNNEGEIAEAAVCNIAFFKDETVFTPPLSVGILAGVTRRLVIEKVAAMAGLNVCEHPVRPSDVGNFSECCLLSTTKDISAVRSIDDTRFVVGTGTMSERLKNAFGGYTRSYAQMHPELRLY